MKNYGGQEKGILRAAVADLLPTEVIARKKCPYPKTIDPVYTSLIEQRIRELLQNKNHLIRGVRLRTVFVIRYNPSVAIATAPFTQGSLL